ncbi:MAG: flagella basal body P-ring formation protein FlgA [Spirochaetes bacterium]|jgi:hypothetical protein|nr:flagella basal body P-ring formation protein FlgA [Spirochaetota bacterium]
MRNLILTVILLMSVPLSAGVKVFLHSSVKSDGSSVTLSDIAQISGASTGEVKPDDIKILQKHMENGYISKQTVVSLLSENNIEGTVFGTSVRMLPLDGKGRSTKKSSFVERGDTVDIIIIRNGIVIETTGVSLVRARPGDKVSVRINKRGKQLKGVLLENRKVEVGG